MCFKGDKCCHIIIIITSNFNPHSIDQVNRLQGSIGSTAVSWVIEGSQNGDLVSRTGQVSFANQQTSASLEIQIRGDTEPELDEHITVRLTSVVQVGNTCTLNIGSKCIGTFTQNCDAYLIFRNILLIRLIIIYNSTDFCF